MVQLHFEKWCPMSWISVSFLCYISYLSICLSVCAYVSVHRSQLFHLSLSVSFMNDEKKTERVVNISSWHEANAAWLITLGCTQISMYNAENNSIVQLPEEIMRFLNLSHLVQTTFLVLIEIGVFDIFTNCVLHEHEDSVVNITKKYGSDNCSLSDAKLNWLKIFLSCRNIYLGRKGKAVSVFHQFVLSY